jgi:hypothetical protein
MIKINKFNDLYQKEKPSIIISAEEIIETHQFLKIHQETLAPDEKDPLR